MTQLLFSSTIRTESHSTKNGGQKNDCHTGPHLDKAVLPQRGGYLHCKRSAHAPFPVVCWNKLRGRSLEWIPEKWCMLEASGPLVATFYRFVGVS